MLIVSTPFVANLMLPVLDASILALDICSETSAARIIFSASETR